MTTPETQRAPNARLCPACRRVHAAEPAEVILRGEFIERYAQEVVRLIERTATEPGLNHSFLTGVLNLEDRIEVTTSCECLARRLGETVQQAWRGELRMHYAENSYRLQILWQRN